MRDTIVIIEEGNHTHPTASNVTCLSLGSILTNVTPQLPSERGGGGVERKRRRIAEQEA